MKKVFIIGCIATMALLVLWKLTESPRKEWAEEREYQNQVEDWEKWLVDLSLNTGQEQLRVVGDGWLGYYVFRSRRFQEELHKMGLDLVFIEEQDFGQRFTMLQDGAADLALATLDSYLLHQGPAAGQICLVVDESSGGDGVVAWDGLASLDDLNQPGLKGAFVGYSPSEFLLKSQIAHFGLDELRPRMGDFRVGSDLRAFGRFKGREVDFAVLWEPFLSQAKELPGANLLVSSKQLRNLIVDVAVASPKLTREKREKLTGVLRAYFLALSYFETSKSDRLQQLSADARVPVAQADLMGRGMRMSGYRENWQDWIGGGLGEPGGKRLQQALRGVADVLVETRDLSQAPTDLDGMIFSAGVKKLRQSKETHALLLRATGPGPGSEQSVDRTFSPWDEATWKSAAAHPTGTLLEEPVSFRSGTTTVPEEFQEQLRVAVAKLAHYPEHRLLVQAHVSPGVDKALDLKLSQQRAEALKQFLTEELNVNPLRVLALGLGSSQPLKREAGESGRAWKRRMRRARVLIVAKE